jgi:hypothetical protein
MKCFLSAVIITFIFILSGCASQPVNEAASLQPEDIQTTTDISEIETEDWFVWEKIEEELHRIAVDIFNEVKANPIASYHPFVTPRTRFSSPVSLSETAQDRVRYACIRLYLSVRHPRTNEIVNEVIQTFTRLYGSPDINYNASTAEINSKVPFTLLAGPALTHRWKSSAWYEESAIIRSNNLNAFPYILIELTFTEDSLSR